MEFDDMKASDADHITSRSQENEKEKERGLSVRKEGDGQRSEGHGNIKGFEFNESGMKLRKSVSLTFFVESAKPNFLVLPNGKVEIIARAKNNKFSLAHVW